MVTFSFNTTNPFLQTIAYSLPDYLTSFLYTLQDNDTKMISPRDLRDVQLSLWSSVPFKQTIASNSNIYYVGIDFYNPVDRSQNSSERKFFFGKRSFSGTYSYSSSYDILNSTLLSSDTDIFFYNTKKDTIDQDQTRILILAGTAFSGFRNAPYIQSQRVLDDTLSFDFVNQLGGIDVRSSWGTVSVNYLGFPTIINSGLSASNGKSLKFSGTSSNASLYWDELTYPLVTTVGTTGSLTQLFGNPFNINGYPFQFTDMRNITVDFNDIKVGNKLNSIPITEILRRMIYPSLKPTCSIRILPPFDNGISEVGTYPSPVIEYTINKKSYSTLPSVLLNMIPGVYPPITTTNYSSSTSTSNGIVISPITATATEFKIIVSDGVVGSSEASVFITGIYPYFYGYSSLSTMTTIGLSELIKKVETKSDKTYDFTGSGNQYFIYPKIHGTLSVIYDEDGFNVTGSFSYSSQIFSSPTGLWASEEFYVYKRIGAPTIGLPSLNYQFQY